MSYFLNEQMKPAILFMLFIIGLHATTEYGP